MTKAQTLADHFDEIYALGIKKEEHLDLFMAWKGGIWGTDDGKKTYIEPDLEAGQRLLAALKVERLTATAEAAGFDYSTIRAIAAGKVTAAQLGLHVDLTVTLPGGHVRSL